MAERVDTQKLSAAVQDAMVDLVGRIREEATERGKVATGQTLNSLRTSVLATPSFVAGTLTGAENWRWWGNGRGPGRMPPIGPIETWVHARGLDISPWAVAKKIAREGSRDFRLGRQNVVDACLEPWQDGAAFKGVGEAGVEVFGGAYVQAVQSTFKQQA